MSLQSLLCRHTWYWSERHGAERCRRCGKLSEHAAVAAQQSAQPETQPAMPIVMESRRRTLFERLDLLTNGRDLSRDEVVETVLDLIEDSQVARPRLSADVAARYFAALEVARRQAM